MDLLKSHVDFPSLNRMKKYRSGFLDICLASSVCEVSRARGRMKEEEVKRKNILKNNDTDIRETWTELYPKYYKVDPPKHIDWRYEKVVKLNYTDDCAGSSKVEYRIVPKKHLVFSNNASYCE